MIAQASQLRIITHTYRARGGVAELFRCKAPEVLLDGPAGTGKSRGTGQLVLYLADRYRGCRIAVVRKTRVSLTESWLVTWENKVLAEIDETYLCQPLHSGPSRATRHVYEFKNGSQLIVAGMDNPTRLFSTEFDFIIVVEATEFSENEWESLHRALRNGVAPYQQLIGECNPDAEYHWLNQRCLAGRTVRLLSRHADNPSLTSDYLERLSNLTGVRRSRLYLGQWVTAEGAIWANFDPQVHVIDRIPAGVTLKWFFGAKDWGFRHAGSMGIFGVDDERNAYLVEEYHRVGQNIEWWASCAADVQKRYGELFRCFVCDPSRPDSIDLFNHRLYQRGDRNCAIEANNDFEAGADVVRERFAKRRLFLLRTALQHQRDAELVESKKPCCLVEEIPSYVYRQIKDGQPVREEPEPDGDDDACDMLRYAMMYLDYSIYEPDPKPVKPKLGSFDHELGVTEFLERCKRGDFVTKDDPNLEYV